jgi:hypothetical protein
MAATGWFSLRDYIIAFALNVSISVSGFVGTIPK